MELNQNDVKAEAVRLREKGHTYKEISSLLNGGVSVDWCKRNLKGVKAKDQQTVLFEKALILSQRKQGVTDKELQQLAKDTLDTIQEGDIVKLKAKIRRNNGKKGEQTLIRPAWMCGENPAKSLWAINEAAHSLYEHLEYLAESYVERYPGTDKYQAMREMVYLGINWTCYQGIEKRTQYNYSIVEKIQD